ncbi:MAG: serine hydrolase [Alphaproteobacteria bacterium]|nr:serine hydrolase [Alphaproteobacteria bacterium]
MSMKQRADDVLAGAVASGAVAGAVAIAADRDGVIYEGAAGVRALGAPAPMDGETVCWLASMTKPIVSVAAVQLIERGAIDPDAPARTYAPALGDIQVMTGFDAAGAPILRPPAGEITMRHLLTHTSGLAYELFNPDVARAQAALGLPGIGQAKNASLMAPLAFDPGARWEYGVGIDWAGKIVEAVSGKTLGVYLRDEIFAPLGMRDTAFAPTPAMQAKAAGMHVRLPDGALAPFPLPPAEAPEFEPGGSGLFSTARDYMRFARMILGAGALDGARVLGDHGMRLVSANQMGALDVTPMKSATPLALDHDFYPGVTKRWSLAFMLNEAPLATGRAAGGLMWSGIANTYFWVDPGGGRCGVFLSQLLPFADPGPLGAFSDFETAIYRG